MKFKYFTNWMGPINQSWIEKNGDDWSAGRIDVSVNELYEDDNIEIYLPMMKTDDWRRLTKWLNDFTTPELWKFQEIIDAYELHNPKINWFKH